MLRVLWQRNRTPSQSEVNVRILLLIDDYYPSAKAGAKLIHDLGVQLLRQAHSVAIVTPSSAIRSNYETSIEDGLQVVRVRTGKLKGVSKIRRAWSEVRLSSTLWRQARAFFRANRFDLIIYYSPTIFFGELVSRLKSLWHCPAYLVLRDIFPKWAVEAGVLRKGLVYRYFRAKEMEQYAAADIIGVESPGNLDYFSRELRDKNLRVEVLPNWASLESGNATDGRYRHELGLDDRVVFFYGGNIGVAQDMDNVLRLAASLKEDRNIFFLLVGEGSEVQRLKACIADQALPNIEILPAVPQEQYFAMLQEFDVGIISLHRNLTSHNMPGKLLGYMSCGKPVLASVNRGNDLSRILAEAHAGVCLENGDDDGFRAAALLLANNSHLRATMGKNSRRLLEERFSDRAAAGQIVSHFGPSVSKAEVSASQLPLQQ
jgi:O26-antigen biosynthesis N-acetyl-L-fucosamine transferase